MRDFSAPAPIIKNDSISSKLTMEILAQVKSGVVLAMANQCDLRKTVGSALIHLITSDNYRNQNKVLASFGIFTQEPCFELLISRAVDTAAPVVRSITISVFTYCA